MDNPFEDSEESEETESKAGPDIDEIPEDNEMPGEHQFEDEEEKGEEKDGGYSPVVLPPDVDWDIIYEARPGRMVLDVVSIGPEPRTIQPGETLNFDVVSGCPMGEQDTDGDYEAFMEHVKATGLRILPVPIRMGPHCRIPFPSERIDTRRDFADYTPMQSRAEFSALATAGLIRVEDKLVIRGLCSNYRDLSEIRVFVTNMGDNVEDLACLDGCIFRLMAWNEIHSQGFPYTRPLLEAYCVDDPEFSWPRRSAGAVVQRAKRSRMLAELKDTDQWLGERYH
jgi:hypothetical protein